MTSPEDVDPHPAISSANATIHRAFNDRMLTPLTASEMIIKEGLDILESALLGN